MFVLLTGWFSFDSAEVTAGDLLAGETVRAWLAEAGIPHRVAMAANFRSVWEVAWSGIDPDEVSHVVFACGPAAGPLVEDLFRSFPDATRVLVGVSVVDGTAALHPGAVIERDRRGHSSPDLGLGRITTRVPVVGVILSHDQPEYGTRCRHGDAHRLIDELLVASDVAPVIIDTRLHPRESHLCGTPGQLESILSRLDAVVTTRLHGLVLALKVGAKVTAQAAALAWPAAVRVDNASADRLSGLLSWCLTGEARRVASRCATDGTARLAATRAELLAALGHPPTGGRGSWPAPD